MSSLREQAVGRIIDALQGPNARALGIRLGTDLTPIAERIYDRLGLQPETESYAVPDSTRYRWVTPWEEVDR